MIDVIHLKKIALDLMDVLLIPAGILAGFMLKRGELISRADRFAYLVFSSGASYHFPSLIRSFFPVLNDNSMGFLTFGSAIFGGMILLNVWRILSGKDFWSALLGRFLK